MDNNLRWIVVGRRGEKRLIKGVERPERGGGQFWRNRGLRGGDEWWGVGPGGQGRGRGGGGGGSGGGSRGGQQQQEVARPVVQMPGAGGWQGVPPGAQVVQGYGGGTQGQQQEGQLTQGYGGGGGGAQVQLQDGFTGGNRQGYGYGPGISIGGIVGAQQQVGFIGGNRHGYGNGYGHGPGLVIGNGQWQHSGHQQENSRYGEQSQQAQGQETSSQVLMENGRPRVNSRTDKRPRDLDTSPDTEPARNRGRY